MVIVCKLFCFNFVHFGRVSGNALLTLGRQKTSTKILFSLALTLMCRDTIYFLLHLGELSRNCFRKFEATTVMVQKMTTKMTSEVCSTNVSCVVNFVIIFAHSKVQSKSSKTTRTGVVP